MDYRFFPTAARRPRYDYRQAHVGTPPAISIVTPFFDPGERFSATMESVFRQTLQSWEWIIVDDASTDAVSLQLLSRAAQSDRRVRVMHHGANRGAGASRNTGYAAATSPYVLQLDADDELEPTAAEKWLWFLHTHPEIAFVNGHTVSFGSLECVWESGFEEGDRFLERNFVGGRGMVRRSVHAEVGGYDPWLPIALEDWDFWLRCAAAGHWGATLPETLDWQHRRGTNAEQWSAWDEGRHQKDAIAFMQRRYPQLFASGIPRIPRCWPQPYASTSVSRPCENELGKESPRLLLLIAWLGVGGTDTFNLSLIERLSSQGWEITVATTLPHTDDWRYEYLRRTPDVFMLHRFLKPTSYPAFLRYLIDSRRYDVVMVSHSEMGYHLLPSLRAWCPHPVYVDYLHIVEPSWKNGGYPRMSLLFHKHLDLTLVSSQQLRDWLLTQGGEAERVEVMATAVDTQRFKPDQRRRRTVRARLGLSDDDVVILFAGRLCEQKRPLLLVDVFRTLRHRGLRFCGLVAGDGELRTELERRIVRADLTECMRLLGAVESDEMGPLMSASDIFFLPSEREGIALSVYEAMASGLAVVATDVGGQRELVAEGTGVLLPPGDDDQAVTRFADAIEHLARMTELREETRMAARARVCQLFSADEMGDRLTELLRRAQRLRTTCPRPALDACLGESASGQAVELMRLTDLCDQLWAERAVRRQGLWSWRSGRVPGEGHFGAAARQARTVLRRLGSLILSDARAGNRNGT